MGKQSIPEATAHIIGSITRSDEGMWSLPTSLMDLYSACHFLLGVLSKYAALLEVFVVWARQHSAQDQKEKSGRRETRRVDNQPEVAFSLITCAVEHLKYG